MATRCSGLSWMVWTWLPSGSWTVARSMLSSTGLFIAPHRWGEARPVLRNQGLRRKTEQRQCDKVRPQVRFRLPPTVITVATLLLWWRTNARSMAGGRYRPGGGHVDRGRRGVHAWVQPDGTWWVNNAGAVQGYDGVLVVDTCATESRTRRFLDALGSATRGAPVRWAVNTHQHGDHTHGNSLLPAETVIIGPSPTLPGSRWIWWPRRPTRWSGTVARCPPMSSLGHTFSQHLECTSDMHWSRFVEISANMRQ